jgi:hypothetical protein
MADPLQDAVETFSAPIESLIVALGQGIADAQTALDRNSLRMQEAIDADPLLSAQGLQATWYQFPRVELQLRMAVSVMEERPAGPTPPPGVRGLEVSRRIIAQPVNAAFQNHFNYSADASSLITLSILPVPPGSPGAPPRLSPDEVQGAALAGADGFATVKDAKGNIVPDPSLRFDVRFNPAARTWYVVQFNPADPAAKAVVAAVDDVTGSVRVITA